MISNSKRLIFVDSREQAHERKRIIEQINKLGYPTHVQQQYVGDYRFYGNDYFVIDRKKTLSELSQNVTVDHERFVREIERAQRNNTVILVLIEEGDEYQCLEDVKKWTNPQANPNNPRKMTGDKLYKILTKMREEYDIDFMFCKKENTGKAIVNILEKGLIYERG